MEKDFIIDFFFVLLLLATELVEFADVGNIMEMKSTKYYQVGIEQG